MAKHSPNVWPWLAPLLGVSVFILDRLTKTFFYSHPKKTISLIPDWLWLHLHVNTDMALSLPLFPLIYFSLTTIVIIALIARLVRAVTNGLAAEYSIITLILAGAISNLLDRFYYGGVVDFIQIWLGSIFNLADCAIVGAVAVWIGLMFYHDRHKKVPAQN